MFPISTDFMDNNYCLNGTSGFFKYVIKNNYSANQNTKIQEIIKLKEQVYKIFYDFYYKDVPLINRLY